MGRANGRKEGERVRSQEQQQVIKKGKREEKGRKEERRIGKRRKG